MGARASREDVKSPHFFFGQVGSRDVFNKEFIVVYQKLVREDDFDDWEKLHQQAVRMNKDSLLVAESYEKERIKKYLACCECPADFEMSILYERFDNLYKTELAKRQTEKRFYSQLELFLIFYDLLVGAKEFQTKGIKLGDVRPSQMVITNSTMSIKMINSASFPWEVCSIDKILDNYDNKTKFYLSPEQIEYIKSPARNTKLPNPKTQAFSLGLTILEAALLQNSEDLYLVNPRQIDLQELNRRVSRLSTKYPLLKTYVEMLLKVVPEERYSCGQLWAVLKPYAEKISETQKFTRNPSAQTNSLQNFRRDGK